MKLIEAYAAALILFYALCVLNAGIVQYGTVHSRRVQLQRQCACAEFVAGCALRMVQSGRAQEFTSLCNALWPECAMRAERDGVQFRSGRALRQWTLRWRSGAEELRFRLAVEVPA